MSSVQAGRAGRADALDRTLALAEGSGHANLSFLAPDVRTWMASPKQGLRAEVEALHGANETARALGRLAPSTLTVVGAAHSDDATWVEIARGEHETCVVGLSHDSAGAVSRLVWLRAPLVPAWEANGASTAPDARSILERYFADLMSSRFGDAASHFTAETIYSHPPYAGGRERVLYRGRDALERGFVTDRGPSPARQIISALWQRASRVFIEGVIEGIPRGGSFFSTAQLSAEGKIARYVAFYSARRIPGP
jgi:hypothetical protein